MIMQKAALLLFTGAFATGCLVLWLVMAIYGFNYRSLVHQASQLPKLTEFVLNYQLAILLVPLPFISYCIFSIFRKPLTSELTAFYVGMLAFVFMTLVLLISAAVLLPMVPYEDSLSSGNELDKSTTAHGMPSEKK